MMKEDRVLLLLGAGVSMGAGMIGTEYIDNFIKKNDQILRRSDGSYEISDTHRYYYCDYLRIGANKLINFIYNQLDSKFLAKFVNYEMVYYHINEVSRHLSGEDENLLSDCFLHKYKKDIESIRTVKTEDGIFTIELNDLFAEALHYIQDIVHELIVWNENNITNPEHLGLIKELNGDTLYKNCYIITTNYDHLIERYCEFHQIDISTCFTNWNGSVSKFEFELNHILDSRLSLVKLHGSTNLFRIKKTGASWESEFYGYVKGYPHIPFKH